MTFTLNDAIALARQAHEGQTDKAGHPYIEHPLRVMVRARVPAGLDAEHVRMAAVLHDVVEDTDLTSERLRAFGCPAPVVAAVTALTHADGEARHDYLARVTADPIAACVKRADVADNSDPDRLAQLPAATADRLRAKYAETLRLLDR